MFTLNHLTETQRADALRLLPCNVFSVFHDLACGHRVKSGEASNACSSNCCHGHGPYGTVEPAYAQSTREFVCPVCVYIEVTAGLGIHDEHATEAELNMQMQELGHGKLVRVAAVMGDTVTHMLEQGYRSAEYLPKINKLPEYAREHPSPLAVTDGDVRAVQYHMAALSVKTHEERLDDLVDIFAGTGLVVED